VRDITLTEYLTEEEQIKQLKTWIKQYGFTVLLGIVLALSISAGWRYWQNYQNRILQHASIAYDEMLMQRAQNNSPEAIQKAKKIIAQYPKTPYASMAALMLARNAILKKDYDEALKHLNWVVDHSKINSLREIALIRIARIDITMHKPNEALNILNQSNDKNFIGLIDEVRGDAYLAKNDPNAARIAYLKATKEIPNAEVTRPILQMKLDHLAIESPQPEG